MNITNSGHYRYNDNFNELFNIYIEECNPKKKQKAEFGRLLGFDNYSHMKKELGYWTDENFPIIEAAILKTKIPELAKAFIEIKFSTIQNKSLDNCLELLCTTGKLTASDLKEYRSDGLGTNSSLSLKQVVTDELSCTNIQNLTLTHKEEVYFINHHWESLPELTKTSIINEKNINHLDEFALKVITVDMLTLYKNKESLVSNWNDKISNEMESTLLLCHKVLFRKNIVSCEILFDSIKDIFSKCHSGTEHEVYVKYSELIDAINKDDQNVISFYNQNCTKHVLNSDNEDYGFPYNFNRNKPKKVSISSILRSNSPLASPVLASYILHSLGDSSFDIERLYACLYVIQKEPALTELCRAFEPLERINDTLTYSTDDLNNEIISVYILSERVQNLKTKDGMDKYIEILDELNSAGNYYLVLTQACRFIQLGVLLIEHNIFSRPFNDALSNASISDIEALDDLEIEAVSYFAKKENILSGMLAIYTSEEMVKNAKFLSEDWIIPLVRGYQKDRTRLRLFLEHTNQQKEAYHMMNSGYFDYNKNFIWMLNVCSSDITREKISFGINKKIAFAFSTDPYNRRNAECSARRDTLTNNQLKLIDMFHYRDHNNDYIWLSEDQVIALDFFIKNKILNKRDIMVKDHSNMFSTIIDKTLHVFLSIDTNFLVEYILKYDIDNIIYYHSPSISNQYKNGQYGYNDDPIIGKSAKLDKVTISNVSKNTMEKVSKLSEHIENLNIDKFEGSNPVSKLAERLAPKFYFMNKEFNEKGKSYC
jgi:hypothetical protein